VRPVYRFQTSFPETIAPWSPLSCSGSCSEELSLFSICSPIQPVSKRANLSAGDDMTSASNDDHISPVLALQDQLHGCPVRLIAIKTGIAGAVNLAHTASANT
jgi:hypothetical protein